MGRRSGVRSGKRGCFGSKAGLWLGFVPGSGLAERDIDNIPQVYNQKVIHGLWRIGRTVVDSVHAQAGHNDSSRFMELSLGGESASEQRGVRRLSASCCRQVSRDRVMNSKNFENRNQQ